MTMVKTKTSRFTLSFLSGLLLCGVSACSTNRIDTGVEGEENEEGDQRGERRDMERNRDASCLSVKAEATLTKKPVDIIFVVDNSGSMADEALAVNTNINKNFATVIGASGLDYRVIMVARHGAYNGASSKAICVTAPLSTNATCTPVPPQPGNNPPKFFHYSRQIESNDSFLRLINTYNGNEPDDFRLAPMGWSMWLRPEAYKVFIGITDDESGMNESTWETNLFSKVPKMFGDAAKRNYVWHSIVGMKENNPPTKPWGPMDPEQTVVCTKGGGAVGPGRVYQRLSILTGGLRFPICEHASFDAVFTEIAKGVITGAQVACDFPIPEPPLGQTVDLGSVIVDYTPMGTGTPQQYKQVGNPGLCAPRSFYIKDGRIYLCPDACNEVQQDSTAKLQILFDCNVG
jgi:hypothetical protein